MQASEHSDAITIKAPAKINPWLLVAKVQKVRYRLESQADLREKLGSNGILFLSTP